MICRLQAYLCGTKLGLGHMPWEVVMELITQRAEGPQSGLPMTRRWENQAWEVQLHGRGRPVPLLSGGSRFCIRTVFQERNPSVMCAEPD